MVPNVLRQIAGPQSGSGGEPTAPIISNLFYVAVADISNPVELNTIIGSVVGEIRITVQVVPGGNNISTVYQWDTVGAVTAAPFVMATTDPGGGKWVAVAGYALASVARFGKAINAAQVALVDGAAIATDASLGNAFTVTLGGNRTLSNPTNLVAGSTYRWRIVQDATGSRTLAYGNLFKWPAATPPVLTIAANGIDLITGYYDGTRICAVANLAFG